MCPLPRAQLATATRSKFAFNWKITAAAAALANKLTLETASDGARILPAYFTDNYVSLLPGESREIEIEYPATAASGPAKVEIRGWNLSTVAIPVSIPAR